MMKSLRSLLLVSTVLIAGSTPVQASGTTLTVDPPDPTTRDAVTLVAQWFASCVSAPDVSRSGSAISITLRAGLCGAPPTLVTQEVELGTLPAGEYSAVINNADPPVTLNFTVLDAGNAVSVKESIGSTAGGTVVNVVVAGTLCEGRAVANCAAPTITFGGVMATNVVVIDSSHFLATTPAHTAGAVQVAVKGDSLDKSSFAFRYYDPAAPLPAKLFEKVLVPIIINGPGASGSNWETELSLRNDNDFTVEPWRAIGGLSAIASTKPLRFGSGNQAGGVFLIVPREASAGLTFQETVRDTSRGDRDFGTEIPIVRERDFLPGVDLLGIPVDPRFRLTLRVYSPQSVPLAGVSIYSLDDGVPLRNFYVPMSSATTEEPAFGAVSNFIAGTPATRIGLRVAPRAGPGPIWAFVTVTNNETQHVTVISPH